ncbi:gliding motility-associated C-terminal domain-containing protein [uncultured Algibacter sp.]|uniref:gliding motility-associated C-terminal domain-containing protein n=1 Tax=uncultured Algibacter sp. TaxID=298659 RepID=UPI0026289144|nr:gliding motility-associated C-terminal domain-containing protein [uncultured Algibacter sp.]
MKTSFLSSFVFCNALFTFLLFGISLNVFAQCPTVDNPNPSICIGGAGYTFNDLNTFVTDAGNGIAWYNVATGGTAFAPNELVFEGTYYAGDSTGSCGTRTSLFVDFVVDGSGTLPDKLYCSKENATFQTYIDDVLQTFIPVGGSVEIYTDIGLTSPVSPTDVVPIGFSTYYTVFIDTGNCESQIQRGQIGVSPTPADPTPDPNQLFCSGSNPTVADLDPNVASDFFWYERLDSNGNPINQLLPTDPLVNGETYYLQIDDIFCTSNPVPVEVTINSEESGVSNTLSFCESKLPDVDFNLFDQLGNPKDNTGTWTGPIAVSSDHLGTVNISALTAGTYVFVYTVPANGTCPDLTSDITITIYEPLSSGTPISLSPSTFCVASLPTSFDLSAQLTGQDSGGQWTAGTLSTDPVVTSPVDLSTLTEGTYFYTYTQNLSPNVCGEESTTIQVDILSDPSAGNAINQTFCENNLISNSPFDLFMALDGTQSNNSGVWRDASNNPISNLLNITGFTFLGSPYSFNYTVGDGSCSDTEIITINIEEGQDSGVANPPADFCLGLAPVNYDLFDMLTGADQPGTWYIGVDNSGAITSNLVDLSVLTLGTYNYTYEVTPIGSCIDELVTVQISIIALPNTGTPMPAVFCENDVVANSPLDLTGQLSGADPGGIWQDDNASGALTGSNVDLTILDSGSYNYTYTITASDGCANSSTVVVTIDDAPESGTPNGPAEYCKSVLTIGQTLDLFDLLTGADLTGAWNDDDVTGTLSGSSVSLNDLPIGTSNFTYNVDAIGSCDDADVTVSIIINDIVPPVAASDQEFCDSATVLELNASGTGINWYDDLTGGSLLDSGTPLINGETYFAVQTDTATGCESSVRIGVTTTIYQSPNSGIAMPFSACDNDSNVDLFNALDGSQDSGGTWLNNDGIGVLTGNVFDATGVAPGSYQFTYMVTASLPCIDTETTITLDIEEPLNAGTNNTLDICSDGDSTDLFSLIGPADIGGTWSPTLASGTGLFDPSIDPSGTYVYSLVNSCGTFTSEVIVTVTQAPDAGSDNTLTICVVDAPTDLFDLLGSTAQSGGTWLPSLASGTGIFDPAIDSQGTYTYTVTSVAPCSPEDAAEIIVVINDTPAVVVLNPSPEYCLIDNPTVADLASSISSTGTVNWYEDAELSLPLLDSDSLVDEEDYFATQTNSTGCESSVAIQVDVIINDAPTPTLKDSNADYCISDGPTINDLSLNIYEFDKETDNVVWYDAETGGTAYDSTSTLTNTTYYAALTDATSGCESSVRLSVTPDVTACEKPKIPDGFSPNGDGVNDTLDIDFLSILYPDFMMEIYNRYGNIVYKGGADTPRFDGTSNQSRSISDGDLPVGVYFYIFNFNDGENAPEQGRIYLSR